jgi:hypothetical protein
MKRGTTCWINLDPAFLLKWAGSALRSSYRIPILASATLSIQPKPGFIFCSGYCHKPKRLCRMEQIHPSRRSGVAQLVPQISPLPCQNHIKKKPMHQPVVTRQSPGYIRLFFEDLVVEVRQTGMTP